MMNLCYVVRVEGNYLVAFDQADSMTPSRRAVLAGCGLFLAAGCLGGSPARDRPDFLEGFQNIAHQGGNLHRPGNTLPAFRHALEVGADVLEMYLWLSTDDEIVVIHDSTVDRTTDGSGRVDSMTLEELQSLDAAYNWSPNGGEMYPYRGEGIRIPTLSAVLEAFPDVPLLLEPKHDSVPPAILLEYLASKDRLDHVMIGAFEDDAVEEVRRLAPDVPTGLGPKEGRQLLLTTRPDERRVDVEGELLFPPYEAVSRPIVERAHRVGLSVYPWTVNDRDAMERLYGHGVDGIITDDPKTLADLIDE